MRHSNKQIESEGGQTERETKSERENGREREGKREREILIKVIFFKVYLGDSNRQPQPSRENLECYP